MNQSSPLGILPSPAMKLLAEPLGKGPMVDKIINFAKGIFKSPELTKKFTREVGESIAKETKGAFGFGGAPPEIFNAIAPLVDGDLLKSPMGQKIQALILANPKLTESIKKLDFAGKGFEQAMVCPETRNKVFKVFEESFSKEELASFQKQITDIILGSDFFKQIFTNPKIMTTALSVMAKSGLGQIKNFSPQNLIKKLMPAA